MTTAGRLHRRAIQMFSGLRSASRAYSVYQEYLQHDVMVDSYSYMHDARATYLLYPYIFEWHRFEARQVVVQVI